MNNMPRWWYYFMLGILVFVFTNVLLLDLLVIKNRLFELQRSDIKTPENKEKFGQKATELTICPNSCIEKINEATSSISFSQLPTPTLVSKKQETSTVVQQSVKEFFVPFGSGSSSAEDWTDITGLQATIDTAQYGKIKSAVFEATVRIPTGNQVAYVRLYNVTDKHPVWFSEMSLEGGTPKLLVSDPITLDKGSKLYQVQMKTSLKFPAILDQARVRITVE